jgi:hypothetical protein
MHQRVLKGKKKLVHKKLKLIIIYSVIVFSSKRNQTTREIKVFSALTLFEVILLQKLFSK